MIKFSKQQFAEKVERIVKSGTSYFDAIQTVCDKHEIEYEAAGNYISGPLREKINAEAIDRKMLKRNLLKQTTHTLPL